MFASLVRLFGLSSTTSDATNTHLQTAQTRMVM
jgi:hypothetical protein